MAKEDLEELIETVKQDKGNKPNASLKRLRPLLKAFLQYSTTADTLPPPTLIPVSLFTVPTLLKTLAQLPEDQPLQYPPQKAGLRLCIQLYLKGLLRLFSECEAEIRPIVVQSMNKSVELLPAFGSIAKKWVRALVEAWSTCNEDLGLGLRIFLCLQKLLSLSSQDFLIWSLRRLYVGFFEHCGQVSWRTLEHINFMGNCFCQLTRIDPERTYYVMFGYIRAIAMQMQALNNAKGKQKVELIGKLYSQQMLQVLRLLGKVVGQAGEEVSALAYPLCQLLMAYESLSQANEYLPLKLHLIAVELTLSEHTGIYIPHTLETLVKVLGCSPLKKKQKKRGGFEGSLELGYRLSSDELRNTNVLNEIFDKTLFYFYWFCVLVEKSVGGPEIVRHACKMVQNIEFGFSGHRKAIKQTVKFLKNDAETLTSIRGAKMLKLNDRRIEKVEALLSKAELKGKDKYLQIMEEREQLFRAKVVAEQEGEGEEEEEDEEEVEDQEELESGWEEASEGASDFQEEEEGKEVSAEQPESSNQEQISYEGDPQDAEEAVKQWSEHEWSSQEEPSQ